MSFGVGCAIQYCGAPGPSGWDANWWLSICQHAPRGRGYWSGQRPYEAGDGVIIEPEPSMFDDHVGLCKATTTAVPFGAEPENTTPATPAPSGGGVDDDGASSTLYVGATLLLVFASLLL
jgi:hypothetical protein